MATNNSANEKTAASGKVLQGQGVGVVNDFSTCTYPSTATGTGKILRADGTNWVATTATYPDTAGTSGNILISDGTNWSSASKGQIITCQTNSFDPADATTYRLIIGSTPTTSATAQSRFYICNSRIITACYGSLSVTGTLGSNQDATVGIRLNNTSTTDVTTTLKFDSATATFSNTGLSISVVAGDFIEFMLVTPTWSPNPTSCFMTISCILI